MHSGSDALHSLVVVDRLTKFVHFVPLSHPYTAAKVANLYLQHVFKLHGMPATIVSDRNPMFTSHFWQELMRLQGVQLAMSSAYHPQTDGQTEVVKKSQEHYLRAFAANRPQIWVEWLPLAEFWFNTNFHTSTKLTPFKALFGYPPPKLLDYIPSTTKVDSVDVKMRPRQQLLALLKQNLVAAQERMKVNADKHKIERKFAVGDWVYLKLLPYKQKSMKEKHLGKLAPRYYGPFQVLHRVGKVSYRLDLPPNSRIHPTFHVSCLKEKLGKHVAVVPSLPSMDAAGNLSPKPVAILENRTHNLRSRTITQDLV